jgi:hypothetical protein
MPRQDQLGAVHTLIHIGCGANPNIDEYISLAQHVWLIDADTEVFVKLEQILQAQDSDLYKNIHTRLALVDVEQRKANFYRYSLSWASGIAPVDEKTQRLYPGLQCLSREEQMTIGIATLVKESLPPTKNENIDNHMLLLGCGYQNEALLQALEDSNELCRFSTVVSLPTHNQCEPIAVPPTLYTLEQSSLELTLKNNSQLLARHPLIKKIKNLKVEAAKDREKLEQQLVESRQQLTERDNQLDKLTKKNKEDAQQVNNVTKMCEDLKQQLEKCTKERNDFKLQLEAKQQELNYRTQKIDEEEIKIEEQLNLIKKLLNKEKVALYE